MSSFCSPFERLAARVTGALGVALLVAACTRIEMQNQTATVRPHRHSYTIPHVLRIADDTDARSLNPHTDPRAWRIADLTMAWLLRSGPDDRPRPELATEVPSRSNGGISPDGKTVTYHLRRDARWSDGVPFTAADVVFSTHAVLNPRNNEPMRLFFDDIAGVSAPDRYTVALRLKRPFGGITFNYFYSVGTPCLLPAHILGRLPNINAAPYNALPVGIGPFKYARWDRGSEIVLVADPLYFRGRPKLDRIIMRSLPNALVGYGALRTHEVDLVSWLPYLTAGTENEQQFSILHRRPFQMVFITLNAHRSPFDDLRVRRAVRLAIDRKRIHELFVGQVGKRSGDVYPVTDSPYPVGHPMNDPQLPIVPFDPAAANRLFESAGWHRGPDGIRTKDGRRLEILFDGSAEAPIVMRFEELLRANLRDVGAEMTIRNFTIAFLNAPDGPLARGNFDMMPSILEFDAFGDLTFAFGCGRVFPNGFNLARFCDPSVDALLAAFDATYDKRERRRISAQIQRKIYDAVPYINLASLDEFWISNTDLHDFRPNHSAVYDDFMNVDI